jgi:hypothetical protein
MASPWATESAGRAVPSPSAYCAGRGLSARPATGNCATRPNTLTTAKGYDSMTGLGATGPNFVTDLAKS